jgi:hypothetical protein
MHQGGTYYLYIASDCAWDISVLGPRGSRLVPMRGSTVVLRDSGRGAHHQTRRFQVPSEWQIRWSYDCQRSGRQGIFSIWVKEASRHDETLAVNELAWHDAGTEYMHQGGTLYLSVESDCPYQVVITR